MAPVAPPVATAHAEIVSFEVAHLNDDKVPLLTHPDLVVTMRARVAGAERPNFGLMIEQLHGVGINTNIVTASLSAVVSAVNRVLALNAG